MVMYLTYSVNVNILIKNIKKEIDKMILFLLVVQKQALAKHLIRKKINYYQNKNYLKILK
ncbi:unnamed protein product [Paramecium sonneborni]|uniref:Uncharacterized protein n=1 Tax=Paramecium sonneborni TaxID=65129 RepID=A0A8S1PRI4_9CILI|nr:unnamed protein product [Paramecium sonneborni]